MRNLAAILGLLLMLTLSGCISGQPPADTYTATDGTVADFKSDREACIASCNEDYSRCDESSAAERSVGSDVPRGLIGASADCRSSLKDCLPRCKGR